MCSEAERDILPEWSPGQLLSVPWDLLQPTSVCWGAASLDLPREVNPIPPTCSVFPLNAFFFQLKGLCVLPGPTCTCVNTYCDFCSISNSVNNPSLVCSEHLQLLLSLPRLPISASPTFYLFSHFHPALHTERKRRTRSQREEGWKRQKYAIDDQEGTG